MTTPSALLFPSSNNAPNPSVTDPQSHFWVTASAGSGKTKILIDRILSLLLHGVSPRRILCITFTNAAATEMANRLNACLASWMTATDQDLDSILRDLLGTTPSLSMIEKAQHLFRDVSGGSDGVSIQTIHSFCQALLKRFPLEAHIPPHFEVLDSKTASSLLKEAQTRTSLHTTYLHQWVTPAQFTEVIESLLGEQARLDKLLLSHGTPRSLATALAHELGTSLERTPDECLLQGCKDTALDQESLLEAAHHLEHSSSPTDRRKGRTLVLWLGKGPHQRLLSLGTYTSVFLTHNGGQRSILMTKKACKGAPHLLAPLEKEAQRLKTLRQAHHASLLAHLTYELLRIAFSVLGQYRTLKKERAVLDYEDLILITRTLLTGEKAPWVLYKLDGGFEHVLLDEAQDTNPEQWDVLAGIVEEFFSGQGRYEETHTSPRTLFVVGDHKQSIYSFQRASPQAFRSMGTFFQNRALASQHTWRVVPLDMCFRSTPAVLKVVDAVFSHTDLREGVVEDGRPLVHRVWRTNDPGRVEVWPLIPKENQEPTPWMPSFAQATPRETLAHTIAEHIESWIHRRVLPSGRTVTAGDILILVRRRTSLIPLLMKALKGKGIPVSGDDRLVLTDHIVVQDLLALGDVMVLPDDDLQLACVLKSPLLNLTEEDLFHLAHSRKGTLWEALKEHHEEPRFASAWAWLTRTFSYGYLSPYAFYSHVLTTPAGDYATGKKALLSRFGHHAEALLDEFLELTLQYGRQEPAVLQTFLSWVREGRVDITTEGQTRDEVRIQTVHSAKGLQAPVVILPDTTRVPHHTPRLFWTGEGLPLWVPRESLETPLSNKMREEALKNAQEEYNRLLYVAMTRAEDWLYVCGEGEAAPHSWYQAVVRGITLLGPRHDGSTYGDKLIVEDHPPLTTSSTLTHSPPQAAPPLPSWAHTPLESIQPVGSSSSPPLSSYPFSWKTPSLETPFRRGVALHALLQCLPFLPLSQWHGTATNLLEEGHTPQEIQNMIEQVKHLTHRFHSLLTTGRTEVNIVGPTSVMGRVDRLLVQGNKAHVVDYKTGLQPPSTPPSYLKQMALYFSLLKNLYPSVKCSLLWTDTPALVTLRREDLEKTMTLL